jgi:hypothetical protein
VTQLPSRIEINPHGAPPTASGKKNPAQPGGEAEEQTLDAEGQRSVKDSTGSALWVSLAGMCAALSAVAFIGCAIWQAGVLLTCAKETADRPRVDRRSLPPPAAQHEPSRPAVATIERTPVPLAAVALVSVESPSEGSARASGASFEARAEAPENAISLGVATLFDPADEAFVIGEPPAKTSPRMSCDDVFVYIVTIAEGTPMQSAASLGIGKTGPARFRRPGEQIGDYSVLAIADDWTGLEPEVWLEKDGRVCPAKLAGNPARVHSALKPAPPPGSAATKRKKTRRRR